MGLLVVSSGVELRSLPVMFHILCRKPNAEQYGFSNIKKEASLQLAGLRQVFQSLRPSSASYIEP
jgi:hypothetical protein